MRIYRKEIPVSRLYTFTLTDGSVICKTIEEARKITIIDDNGLEIKNPVIQKRIEQIIENSSNRRRIQDGFQPGFQPNINEYCGDRKQYDAALRAKGLVEVGNERIDWVGEKRHSCANEGFIKSMVEEGIPVDGNEAEAILSGEFFKD